jgi:hypothetical protein
MNGCATRTRTEGRTTVTTTTAFKRGDKVREIKFGGTYTVLHQRGSLMVFVEELLNGWIHPGNLRLVSEQAEDLEVAER